MGGAGLESHDDLTNALIEVVKLNNRLRVADARGAATHETEELWMAMSNQVWGIFNNASPSIPTIKNKSENAIKSISERLKVRHRRRYGGKEGRS